VYDVHGLIGSLLLCVSVDLSNFFEFYWSSVGLTAASCSIHSS